MCDIETAKDVGAIGVLALLEGAGLAQRLLIARAMHEDAHLRHLVNRAAGYMMSEQHREAAFWLLLSSRLEGDVLDQDYLASLKRLRRADKRSPSISSGYVMKSHSIIARTAKLESATELLAKQMGYLANRSIRLERIGCQDTELLQQLESMRDELRAERDKLSLDNEAHTMALIEKYGRNRVSKLRVTSSSPSASGPIDNPVMEELPNTVCPECGEPGVYFVPDQKGTYHSGQFRNHWAEGYWCDSCGTNLEEDK